MDWQTEKEYYKGRTIEELCEAEQRALVAAYLCQAGFDANFESLGTECQYHNEGVGLNDIPPWAVMWRDWVMAMNNRTAKADALLDRISDDLVNYWKSVINAELSGVFDEPPQDDEHKLADNAERARDVRATLRSV